MPLDIEIIDKFQQLKSIVNKIRNFDDIFPDNPSNIEQLITWIAHFLNPSINDLDILTQTYGVELTDDEKKRVYPLIIRFVLFVKSKYQTY